MATPAIFLDRDGVLSEEAGYVTTQEQLHIFSYSKECVRILKSLGYLTIVITNQSAVARGMIEESVLQELNQFLQEKLQLDAIYYCPHHPEALVEKYCQVCRCRKPNIGLIEQACADYEIDLKESYMVGDRGSDIMVGQTAGVHTILVESGYGIEDVSPEVIPEKICRDLKGATEWIRIQTESDNAYNKKVKKNV